MLIILVSIFVEYNIAIAPSVYAKCTQEKIFAYVFAYTLF